MVEKWINSQKQFWIKQNFIENNNFVKHQNLPNILTTNGIWNNKLNSEPWSNVCRTLIWNGVGTVYVDFASNKKISLVETNDRIDSIKKGNGHERFLLWVSFICLLTALDFDFALDLDLDFYKWSIIRHSKRTTSNNDQQLTN